MEPPAPPPFATSLLGWGAVLAEASVRLGAAIALAPFRPAEAQRLYRAWAEAALERAGIELHVENRSGLPPEPRGALFVLLNQQTLLAPVIYGLTVPCGFRAVTNVEFAALPFLGWFVVSTGAVVIVRQYPPQAKAAMRRVVEGLRRGENFGISIEGRRTGDGALSPYKKGPAVIAIESGCDIVPVMTHGEYRLWPRGEWRVRPGRIDAVIYPPVSARGLTYADRHDLIAELRRLAEIEVRAYEARSALAMR